MKETPILFSAEMIRAYLSGLKSQTRRVIKPQPPDGGRVAWLAKDSETGIVKTWVIRDNFDCCIRGFECPYGQPGDRLWVQEGYQITHNEGQRVVVHYLTDDHADWVTLTDAEYAKWRARKYPYRATPGRFMYKSLARIRVPILSIRVERVQDISEEDAIAEGIHMHYELAGWTYTYEGAPKPHFYGKAVYAFRALWDSINTKRGYGWTVNPWVWAIEFKKL